MVYANSATLSGTIAAVRPSNLVGKYLGEEQYHFSKHLGSSRRKIIFDFSFLFSGLFFFSYFLTPSAPVSFSLRSDKVGAPEPHLDAFDINGDFNPVPIQYLCAHKLPQKGLYLTCNESNGGFGNLRNSVLLCTRYAIELGADLVIPQLKLRSTIDLANLDGNATDLSYLFDTDIYKQRIMSACPGFIIYDSVYDIPSGGPNETAIIRSPPDKINFADLQHDSRDFLLNKSIFQLRPDFNRWLRSMNVAYATPESPLLVDMSHSYFEWHKAEDFFEVWREFGKILKFNRPIYDMAYTALAQMARYAGLPLLSTERILISDFRYVGAHLRTEADASNEMKMMGFDEQMGRYIEECHKLNITVMYLASGDQDETEKARVLGAAGGIFVFNKYSLLEGQSLERLMSLTFDQQALVDYLILLRATKFVGVDSSSFSANLAIARHDTLNDFTYWTDFEDELSILIGGRFTFLREAIWP